MDLKDRVKHRRSDFKHLKESIPELGILTPLRVAADMTLASGHQRYRAAKELGLVTVPVNLICANFRALHITPYNAKWQITCITHNLPSIPNHLFENKHSFRT